MNENSRIREIALEDSIQFCTANNKARGTIIYGKYDVIEVAQLFEKYLNGH